MTKADQTRDLLDRTPGLKPWQIAERVGCSEHYVRGLKSRERAPDARTRKLRCGSWSEAVKAGQRASWKASRHAYAAGLSAAEIKPLARAAYRAAKAEHEASHA